MSSTTTAADGEATAASWSALLAAMPQAAWLVALATRRVVAANAAADALLGGPGLALVGRAAEALAASPEDPAWWQAAAAGRAGNVDDDTVVTAADGRVLHVRRSIGLVRSPAAPAGGAPSHALVMLGGRSADRVAAEESRAPAPRDALSGLPGRRELSDRIAAAAVQARRDGSVFALLVIDLDRFRRVNDSLGHATGDRVLNDVARRIGACLRQDDVLALLGGDQFAVLVTPADATAAAATARRILKVVAQPCSIDGAQFTITCSIGMALGPAQGSHSDELWRHAEAAMRAVKLAGRASFKLHQARAEVDRRSHMRLDHAMRQALVSGRFRLHYQPQVDLTSGAIVGAEALLRWRDPELGDVTPARFIPVAEDSGFIVAIGDWVLSQAVRQAALWQQRGHALPIAVNVSALQFQQASFVDRVASVLAVSGVPARLLELELTESILVHDADEALHRLHELAQLGVRLSIDDFGTGYSSLAYLKRFPIGKLKIDRSFVQGLPADDSDAAIVRAILQVAQALGLQVIAEGVETEAQRKFLQAGGCHEFQGYLFAPALDCLSFEQRLDAESARQRLRLVRG